MSRYVIHDMYIYIYMPTHTHMFALCVSYHGQRTSVSEIEKLRNYMICVFIVDVCMYVCMYV